MGFATSFLSGVTLTSSLLYFSLLHHQNSRIHQASILHSSALQLNSLVDPQLASDLATIAEQNYSGGLREGIRDYRLERRTGFERLKDGWNSELESGVRWVQGIHWNRVREGIEERAREWRDGGRRV